MKEVLAEGLGALAVLCGMIFAYCFFEALAGDAPYGPAVTWLVTSIAVGFTSGMFQARPH